MLEFSDREHYHLYQIHNDADRDDPKKSPSHVQPYALFTDSVIRETQQCVEIGTHHQFVKDNELVFQVIYERSPAYSSNLKEQGDDEDDADLEGVVVTQKHYHYESHCPSTEHQHVPVDANIAFECQIKEEGSKP